ncbi:histidine phosphatase family protein [Metabacillus iocasae]|uniref:Phosphatase n=1 Tax=Priestia iocasae TaxID=2291674 RepID=A0ABS2QVH1_9BACI|nr:putative phosphatase [Metabacillus iocasae]
MRHGQTDWNKQRLIQGHSNIPLNEKGREQAKKVAEAFRDKRVDVMYSSDLLRAYETALEIAKVVSVEKVTTCKRLRERSFGDLEAQAVSKLEELVPGYGTNWGSDAVYNMERLEDAQKRLTDRLVEIVEEAKNKHVVVVSHGAIINLFIHFVTNGEDGTGKRHLENTSISTFKYKDGEWEIVEINNHDHLVKSTE